MAKTVRLDKFLAAAGYGSRKEIKKIVRQGKVTVNGEVIKDSSVHVAPEKDRVTVDMVEVIYRELVYLILNKPSGYITSTEDSGEPTVMEFIPEEFSHYKLFPVGRLDRDTEGLLLLTNDGKLAHDLLAPKKHIPKTYYVKVDGHVSDKHIEAFSAGIILDDGYNTMPSQLVIRAAGNAGEARLTMSEVELTIYEGKFHQVKRMFAAFGMQVIYLKRIAMGQLQLDPTLNPGDIRELKPDELAMLREG
ncbi:MAG: 16S rRNA pseudouridine(516) synthase [Firmicutes bacterium HGW-Firmicutes-14]|nr:MAG: 16S rRNA pseudouridine(516) synthase [Firmicutes bacterium HGW-Firmicutes-14]